jgi:hypothetical protein
MRSDKFREKGWSEAEIKRVEKIVHREEKEDVFFSKIVFWSALVVIIFANLIVSLIMVPFLIVMNQWMMYLMVVVLAGTIGFLYNFLITDIGHLEKKHHISAGIIVPILAILNMVIVVIISNRFILELDIKNSPFNPFIVSGVFAVAFIVPYLISLFRNKHEFKS